MIPFNNLEFQYLEIREDLEAELKKFFLSNKYILGPNVQKLEEEFAAYCKKNHAVGVASGTDALSIALKAFGIKQGEEVITVANTAIATVAAIEMAGGKPVFVDIKEDGLIDPLKIEGAITGKTKVIIPVHLYGQPCDMDPIQKIAKEHGLFIIEDCCQAHGAKYKGVHVPIMGTGCFSFYPTKNLGCYGDGGMIVTNDHTIAKYSKLIRNYGETSRYHNIVPGVNSRLDEIQASILRIKLKKLDKWNDQRKEIAEVYKSKLTLPSVTVDMKHSSGVYHLYVIRSEKRELLRTYLEKSGIGTLIHYPLPIHLQEAYKHLGYKKGSLPVTEKLAGEIISLPLYIGMKREDVLKVCDNINDFN